MTTFDQPAHVRRNRAARRLASQRSSRCAGNGGTCPNPSQHACAKYGGAYCHACWLALGLPLSTPQETSA